MSLAYFPMYADRYEADTAHLSILEDGAYNRLLRLCWRSPACKLPNDLSWIFRQCRAVSEADQAAVKAVLDEFFTKSRGKIWNKKLAEVYVQVSVAHSNKSEAGKKGAVAKALKNNKTQSSTAKAELKQPEPEPKREEKKEGGGGYTHTRENHDPADKNQPPTFREKILTAIGIDPVSGLTGHGGRQLGTQGDMAEAERWLDLPNISEAVAIQEIKRIAAGKRDGPPKSFSYFNEPMQRLSATLSAPALQPIQSSPQTAKGGRHERNSQGNAAILELASRVGAGDFRFPPNDIDPFASRE